MYKVSLIDSYILLNLKKIQMENQKSSSSLKAVIAVLAILLVGSLVYIFKMSSDADTSKVEMTNTITEKESVMKDLQELKTTYDAAIAENTSMSDELIQERDKVVNLMSQLSKSKGDVASLSKYRTQFNSLQANMKVLMTENENLKLANTTLTTQRDSTVVVLGESRKNVEALTGQNEELSKAVEMGSKLTVLNTRGSAFKVRSSGKQIETDKARRADVLRVSFTIAENVIAKSGNKSFYVQVIDGKNNVIGDKKTENFDDDILTYSFITNVNYDNKTVQVTEDLKGKDFVKGTYFINIFDKGQLVSKTSFILR
ncbi:regulator of replication initiation timing [Flavobacterium sp. PL11]|nr:regulator of replication initiation timing [Flavobacterium sp. PL11]